jgi:uncharacterized protein (TIGR02246 family)
LVNFKAARWCLKEETMVTSRWKIMVVALLFLTLGAGIVTAQILDRLRARAAEARAVSALQDKEAKKGPAVVPPEIFENAKAYMEAYNRHDIKALLDLFTADCVTIGPDGDATHGLKELEADFKDDFDEYPQCKISLDLQDIRMISPDVAVEQGKTTFFPDGKTATHVTPYEAIHVKVGKRWLVTSVRSFNPESLTPYDRLMDLEWLIGDWIDESPDSIVESTYAWDDNKSFLLHKFVLRVGGKKALQGTERIGWDPVAKHVRSWIFDSEGGFGERFWTYVDDSWIITAKGIRPDADIMTATVQLTRLGRDRMKIASVDRIIGDERMPNQEAIVVRRPPAPKK